MCALVQVEHVHNLTDRLTLRGLVQYKAGKRFADSSGDGRLEQLSHWAVPRVRLAAPGCGSLRICDRFYLRGALNQRLARFDERRYSIGKYNNIIFNRDKGTASKKNANAEPYLPALHVANVGVV